MIDDPSSQNPLLQPPGVTPLPSSLETLAIRVSRWPWWLIILLIGLVVAFYGILTTPDYHRALIYVTNDPQISTTDFKTVTYILNLNGQTQRVSGTVVSQSDDAITIRTVNPQSETVAKNSVTSVQKSCPPGIVKGGCEQMALIALHTDARTVKGSFYTESATEYRIQLPDGSLVAVKKLDVRSTEQRNPAGCQPDIKGGCEITVTIPPTDITGTLLSETDTAYTVQTVPPEFITIKPADIVSIISENAGQCALNNLASCQAGIFLTAFLAIIAYTLAVLIGLIISLMRISTNPFFKNFATLYVEVVRGIPILVILLIFFFGIGPWVQNSLHLPMPDYLRGILGLAFAYGAFLAEIFRAGIQSISRGQMEAARSLGMTYFQAMRHVILPQAIRVVLPPLGNDFIAMLKDTSLVAIISLNEMTQLASLLNGRTYKPFEAFLTIAVLYLVMTLALSFFVRVIEHRMRLPA